ncbi:hypothetical protein A9Q84_16045 [Halobacteriovorax marinus]|uniref:UDP-3-O-acylglucosamine N-acyltransferase n=1 Tax=Halobacteriovorax marinus TaxID=97084 RepID=A0A1Y5F465_9BACT|nr:hypothetical protein A9Q84_16045 [Halobacteriovorax marinus]
MAPQFTLEQILEKIEGASLKNCPNPELVTIKKIVTLDSKEECAISYLATPKMLREALDSKVSVLVISKKFEEKFDDTTPLVIVEDAEYSLISLLNLFHPEREANGQISKTAAIDSTAIIGEGTEIEDFVIIGKNVKIGNNCIIQGGSHIGHNVTLGNNTIIGPGNVVHHGVTIGERFRSFGNCTIGSDGFRFTHKGGAFLKISQVGGVVIGDDVEFGANCCIDRGGLTDTLIGNGVKLDNMVHIAHNCILKNHIVIAAQSGVAGSSTIGNYVMISGQCAITDHIEIADGVRLGGKTGVRQSIEEKGTAYAGVLGLPIKDFHRYLHNVKHVVNFRSWAKRIVNIEKNLGIEDTTTKK